MSDQLNYCHTGPARLVLYDDTFKLYDRGYSEEKTGYCMNMAHAVQGNMLPIYI